MTNSSFYGLTSLSSLEPGMTGSSCRAITRSNQAKTTKSAFIWDRDCHCCSLTTLQSRSLFKSYSELSWEQNLNLNRRFEPGRMNKKLKKKKKEMQQSKASHCETSTGKKNVTALDWRYLKLPTLTVVTHIICCCTKNFRAAL